METSMQTCSFATLNSGSVESDPIDLGERRIELDGSRDMQSGEERQQHRQGQQQEQDCHPAFYLVHFVAPDFQIEPPENLSCVNARPDPVICVAITSRLPRTFGLSGMASSPSDLTLMFCS